MKPDLPPGTELSGYRIQAVLGRGGMSVVYLAEHARLKRKVAFKVIAPGLADDPSFRTRFIRESELAASIDHPNIIPIYDAGEVEGILYIAMRYVSGPDLKSLLAQEGPLGLRRTVSIMSQVADALDSAHSEGLVHRDVKPANILVVADRGQQRTDHVYLTDFGVTKRHSATGRLTATGQLLGTVDYIAPEQIEGQPVDARTDIYSFGCVCYECLTGLTPYPKDSDVAVLWAHMQEPPPSLSAHRPDLPRSAERAVAKAMAKSPDNRFPSCRGFAQALEEALSESDVQETSEGVALAERSTAVSDRVAAGKGMRIRGTAIALCPKCGEENPDRFRLCGYCGTPLEGSAKPQTEERKVVSILFVDLVGFTARSHGADPEDVRAALGPYHALLKREIQRFGGTVEKFIGDAVMAVFGAPVTHEDDAERAVRAALRIADAIEELNSSNTLDLSIRAAVNTGEGLVALGARPEAGEGMVTGDVVNTASRLQSAAPANGVVVGEITYRSTKGFIDYQELEPVTLKGKPEPLALWRALSAKGRFGVDADMAPKTPFIGRDYELDLLKATFRRALREASLQLVTIVGEPGVGKSRLLSEFSSFIDEHEELIFWRQGRSLPYGEGITFWGLGEIIKAHADILESDSSEQATEKLRSAVITVIKDASEQQWFISRLAPLVGVEISGSGTPQKEESFTAWRRFLEAIAEKSALVLVFEDLHWADPSLLEFIEHLVDWVTGVPMFVVCTARPELYDQHPDWGGGKRNFNILALSPLDDSETAELISSLLSQAVLPAEIQAALLERAGGNPLYAEEFVRMLSDRGILTQKGRVLTLDEDADIPVPDNVHALIAARVDTLPGDRKTLLYNAAVAGKVFWSGAVAALGETDDHSARKGLHELVGKELVRPSRTSTMEGHEEYVFWHALIRDVCYGQIPRATRAKKHQDMAAWIETVAHRVGDYAEILAHHYGAALELAQASGETEELEELRAKTRRFTIAAAERAKLLDPTKALSLYDQALELLETGDVERASILLESAAVCNDLALLKEAEERARGALALFESCRDVIGQGKALLTLGYALDGLGQITAALTAMEEALVVLETHGPSGELSHAYFNAGFNALFYSGKAGEGLTFAEKALQIAEACGEQSRIAKALDLRGLARTELGDPLGVEDVRESLRLALLLGDPNTIAHLYGNLADGIWLIDGPRPSLDLLTEGLEFAQSRGQVRWVSWLKADGLEGAFELGLWADVLQQADDLMEWERRHEFPVIRCTAMEAKTRVLIETEGTQRAASLITPLLSLARDLVDLQDLVPSLAIAATAYAKLHEHAASQKLIKEFEQKTDDAANYRARYLPEVVRILVAVDEVEWADRLIPQTNPPLPRNQHAAVTATAIVAEARGEHARALALHQDAADRWKRYGFVLEEGQALFGAGRCLLALGGNVESHKSLQEAREIFARLGARPLIEEIDNCLRQGKAVGS